MKRFANSYIMRKWNLSSSLIILDEWTQSLFQKCKNLGELENYTQNHLPEIMIIIIIIMIRRLHFILSKTIS